MRRISAHDPLEALLPYLDALGVDVDDAVDIANHIIEEKLHAAASQAEKEVGHLLPKTLFDGIHGDHQLN